MAPEPNRVQIDYGHFASQIAMIEGFPPFNQSNAETAVNHNKHQKEEAGEALKQQLA
jgi:hypothetical protein